MKNKKTYKLEACVDSLSDAINAYKQGAHQVELCSRLDLDGLSPSSQLVKSTIENIPIHIKVMLRTHNRGFSCSQLDLDILRKEIDFLVDIGINEVVFGAIKDDRLDIALIETICNWAYPMTMTVHKAIDTSLDIVGDCKRLAEVKGVTGILSSGGYDTAIEGMEMLKQMKEACGETIGLIPAGRITYQNVEAIDDILKCQIYHGRRIVDMKS